MAQYRYRATGPGGAPLEDTIEAASAHQATQRLQERGYTVNSLEVVQGEFAAKGRAQQLSWTELEALTQQLLSITEHNLPLSSTLQAMTSDMPSSRLKAVVDQVRIDLERGVTIEEALRNRGSALPPMFARAVRAGEASGAGLPGILLILVRHAGRMVSLQYSLQTALAYPLLVLALACGVAMLLLVRVVPAYDVLIEDMSHYYSGTKGGLLHSITAHPVAWAAGLVVLTVASYFALRSIGRTYATSLRADRFKLRIPRFGRVYYLVTVARFSRTLAALMMARVPIIEAIELAAAASGSPLLEQAAGNATPRVALGHTLADALEATGYFEKSYSWLLRTAERRNAAEEALSNLAESCEREAEASDKLNNQLVGPVALVIVGLVVLIIAYQFMIVRKLGGLFGGDVISGV